MRKKRKKRTPADVRNVKCADALTSKTPESNVSPMTTDPRCGRSGDVSRTHHRRYKRTPRRPGTSEMRHVSVPILRGGAGASTCLHPHPQGRRAQIFGFQTRRFCAPDIHHSRAIITARLLATAFRKRGNRQILFLISSHAT